MEPWRCEGCGWTNVEQVRECDGCGEAKATAELDRAALVARLAEAERVLRVTSGWNPDRVDVATAIQPAAAYFASKDLAAKEAAARG